MYHKNIRKVVELWSLLVCHQKFSNMNSENIYSIYIKLYIVEILSFRSTSEWSILNRISNSPKARFLKPPLQQNSDELEFRN